jgi:hypothetical protein
MLYFQGKSLRHALAKKLDVPHSYLGILEIRRNYPYLDQKLQSSSL